MTDAIAVNPLEGQVAIPYAKAGGRVIGRLNTRAMVWIEENTGKPLDDIYRAVVRKIEATRGEEVYLSVRDAAVILWAAIENERRSLGDSGPQYTIDDAYAIVDEVGVDDAYNYAFTLVQLSVPFKKRTEAIEAAAKEAGEPNPLDPMRAAAARGTGESSSTSPLPTVSPNATPGT